MDKPLETRMTELEKEMAVMKELMKRLISEQPEIKISSTEWELLNKTKD